jgi:hypothetical protein
MTAAAISTAELAALLPCLAGALRRDNTTMGRSRSVVPGVPVNSDVLHAMVTLHREVPDVTMAAAELAGEPWQRRTIAACLTAIPRLGARLHDLAMVDAERDLERGVYRWTRVTKLALGLRTPDIPIGAPCPHCGHDGPGLMAVGSEGFMRRTGHGLAVEWEHAGRVVCRECGAAWGVAEWPLLGRVLEAV